MSHSLEVHETFSFREDKLTLRVTNVRNGQVHEHFAQGRSDRLKGSLIALIFACIYALFTEHIYTSNNIGTRTMTFYSQ